MAPPSPVPPGVLRAVVEWQWPFHCLTGTDWYAACSGGRAVAPPSQVRPGVPRAVVGGQWIPPHRYSLVYCVRWWDGSASPLTCTTRCTEDSGSPLIGMTRCTDGSGSPSLVRPGVLRTLAPLHRYDPVY